VAALTAGADAAALVQVLIRFEADPPPMGGRRLIDPEADVSAEAVLDAAAVRAYCGKLRELQEGLSHACRGRGVAFASVTAGVSLDSLCRTDLLPAGVLGVRR
jgi:hypothetical protein